MIENENGMIRETIYIPHEKKMVSKLTYDNTEVLEQNAKLRNRSKSEQYKGDLVHVGSISLGDIERLKNIGYNLLSPDKDEVKRTLLYIQTNEPSLLVVKGKPFSKTRNIWV